jgi:hypothetical protein
MMEAVSTSETSANFTRLHGTTSQRTVALSGSQKPSKSSYTEPRESKPHPPDLFICNPFLYFPYINEALTDIKSTTTTTRMTRILKEMARAFG